VLKDGGLGSILLPLLIIGLSYASFIAYKNQIYGIFLIAGLTLFCLSLQSIRKDKNFVQLHLQRGHQQMFLEYVLICLPFSLTALFTVHFYYFPLLLTALWFMPKWKFVAVQKTNFKTISNIFPSAYAIEWISGFRKSFVSIITLYIVAVACCWIRFLPLLLLWFITTTILNFYNEFEPIHILKSNHSQAKLFLKEKLIKHCQFIAFFYAPVLTINSLFNTDFLEINILFLGIQMALLCFGICLKYSSYVPQEQNLSSNITLSIVSLGSIIPFLLPLPIIFCLVYYKKAVQNLNTYFFNEEQVFTSLNLATSQIIDLQEFINSRLIAIKTFHLDKKLAIINIFNKILQ
jgi:hypothetical protein